MAKKSWIDAAKNGDLEALKGLLTKDESLLHAKGPGVGHTAAHWAAAKGNNAMLRWLLDQGAKPNALNEAGATALHSAAGNGQMDCAKMLISAGADPSIKDDDNQTARDIAAGKAQPRMAVMLEQLSISGARPQQPVLEEVVPPADPKPAPKSAPRPAAASSDDEEEDPAAMEQRIATSKQKGNEAFAKKDYNTAMRQYSIALRLKGDDHILLSNRSAAYSGLGKFEEALYDANKCLKLAPDFVKGYARKGAALIGQGLPAEAIKAFDQGLAKEPDNAMLLRGKEEARLKIEGLNEAYEQMHGKDKGSSDKKPTPVKPATTANAGGGAAASSSGAAAFKGKAVTAEEKAAKRAALRAAQEAADEAEEEEEKQAKEHAAELAKAAGVTPEQGQRWMEAAKSGDSATLGALLRNNKRLLEYKGEGAQGLGFTGHTALHWAAAKGHTDATRFLLKSGMNPDITNRAGGTALHAAAGNDQPETARVLLMEGMADGNKPDDLGETAKDLAQAKGFNRVVQVIDLGFRVVGLRAQDPSNWAVRAMRALLVVTDHDINGVNEKDELRRMCKAVLEKLPQPVINPNPS